MQINLYQINIVLECIHNISASQCSTIQLNINYLHTCNIKYRDSSIQTDWHENKKQVSIPLYVNNR